MTWVTSRLLRPDGTPVVGQCVTATLKTLPAWLANHTGQVVGQVRTHTDSTGLWRLDLLPYTDFETSGYVYYEINEGPGMPTWLIRVPPASTPPVDVWLHDILTGALPTPPGTGVTFPSYHHIQTIAATVWTVNHGLGRYPAAVSLFSLDLAIQYDEFSVQHLSVNSLRISMDLPETGRALIM